MEPDYQKLALLFPNIAAQLRGALSSLHLAAAQLAPSSQRERDPTLDTKAALLDQSYYQLLRLINNLTAAASLFTEEHPALRDCDIVELVGQVCSQAESLAGFVGLDFQFRCQLSRHICAVDPSGLEQLLFQLLSNAFKFTPSGGQVTVELRRSGDRILLSVTDNGRGIESSQVPILFDRYLHPEQLDPSPHGLGLGLPLCQRIAEGMGGCLMAESSLGKGSRFTLSIPDRTVGGSSVSDVAFDYTGGVNRALLALADAMPSRAFLRRNQD